jgi:hypothetical protein
LESKRKEIATFYARGDHTAAWFFRMETQRTEPERLRARKEISPKALFLLDAASRNLYIILVSEENRNYFEGELWVPRDSFLAPLSYQTQPSSFYEDHLSFAEK